MSRRKVTDMNDWRPIWQAIDKQRVDDGLTWETIYERTGLSDTTMLAMRNDGKPLVRADKVRGLLRGLGWVDGSIERILAGGDPELAPVSDVAGPGSNGAGLEGVERRLAAVEELLKAGSKSVDELLQLARSWTSQAGPASEVAPPPAKKPRRRPAPR